ncbi:MAG: hypothetical protein WBM00_06175 [Solirubrobacterales bacterium]
MSDDAPNTPPSAPRRGRQPAGAGARVYSASIRVFSSLLIVLGLLLLVATFARGGGPLSIGVLMGVSFLGVGVARLWLSARMHR